MAALTAAGGLDWPLIAVRWLGATLLVPVIEELFWRSFLMRWIEQPVFEGVDPQRLDAVTNGVLGAWVVATGNWRLW